MSDHHVKEGLDMRTHQGPPVTADVNADMFLPIGDRVNQQGGPDDELDCMSVNLQRSVFPTPHA